MNRRAGETVGVAVLALVAAGGVALLLGIVGSVFWKGGDALSLEFLLQESRDFGTEGGILYQALGTLLLMTAALILSLPVALGTALFQTEFLASGTLKKILRNLIYSLNAIPTILFGMVGYLVFAVYLGAGVSWVTGALILAVMIFPTLQVSIQEAIEALPEKYRETGMALGMTPWSQIRSILLPQSIFGIVTGGLLGLARAAGETAAILFTATTFAGIRLPHSWTDPVPTLQTHILVLAQEAVHPKAIAQAWGAALVLLTLVFLLIAGSLVWRNRMPMESER